MDIQNNLQPMIDIVKNIIPLREAYLFGSYAYGNPTSDSDYDLYFVAEKIDGNRYDTIAEIKLALYDVTQNSIDVLLSTKERFDSRKDYRGTLEYKVAKDGVMLYEQRTI